MPYDDSIHEKDGKGALPYISSTLGKHILSIYLFHHDSLIRCILQKLPMISL